MDRHKIEIVIAVLVLTAFSIGSSLLYMRNSYPFGGDLSFYYNGLKSLYSSFFIWIPNNYSGLIGQAYSNPISLFFNLLYIPFLPFGIAAVKYTAIMQDVLLRIFGSVGMFFFVCIISPVTDSRIKTYSGFLAAMVFVGVFADYGTVFAGILFVPIALLLFYLFEKSVADRKPDFLLFILSVIALSFNLSIIGELFIEQGFLLVFLFFLGLMLVADRKIVIKQVLYGLLVIFLVILILLPSIAVPLLSDKVLSGQLSLVQNNSASDFTNYAYNIVQSLANALPFFFDTYPSILSLISIIVSVISVFSVSAMLINQRTKVKYKNGALLGLLLSLLAYFGLSASTGKPFGVLFSWVYRFFPVLVAFRYGSASSQEIFFVIIALFGVGISYLFSLSKLRSKWLLWASVSLVIVFCLVFLYFNTVLPILTKGVSWTNHLLPFIQSFPPHVVSIASYINMNGNGYSVATLPSDDDWHLSNWYDAPDVYTSLINAPVYTGGFTSFSEFFFPASQDEYRAIAKQIEERNLNGTGIMNAFGAFGIKYIIIQGNTSNKTFGPNHPLVPYKFSSIYHNLNVSGAELVTRSANSSIYINNLAVPLAYATNIKVTNYTDSISIINQIKNENINTVNYSLYSRNLSGPILWYGNAALFNSSYNGISTINDFSKPNVSFVENTPTKVTVHIKNATTPYYLVFRETYDPHWAAFFSNGTEVNPRDHIAVNGFANAWYMNKTGNYTVTLYYTLQTDAWLTWAVSFAALFATIGIGVYGWRRDRTHV